MFKKFLRLSAILILLPAILLQGCWIPYRPNLQSQMTSDMPDVVEFPEVPDRDPIELPLPSQFTLRYETAFTMNPIFALNRDNIVLTSLLYESLFILDDNLTAIPMLCVDWYSEDNVNYTFEIMPNVEMHDGSLLTAEDVAYSLRHAMNQQRSRHRSKLHSIDTISTDGDYTISITLKSPNARFIRLLDIPIIKSGSIDLRIPPGTGPYLFAYPEAMQLSRFSGYRYLADLPLTSIHLLECSDSDLTQLFDNGVLSLLWDDPGGAFDIRLTRPHEPRLYNTTALQYLGFNANSFVLRNPNVRRAIGCAIERQYIVDNIMNDPRAGQAIAAPVAISPIFDMYDTSWEARGDLLNEMGLLIEQSGLEDYFSESFLAAPDGGGGYRRFTLNFIVNIENSHKLAAAMNIADNLRQYGFDVTVRTLQWNEFIKALEDGKFDMYYGETLLGADFDFSPLLLPGDGNLNFGGTANTAYRPLIDNFLAAETQEEVSIAGENLNLTITQNAPFIPILYKRYAIYTHMGVIARASPSQSGVFHNFHEWSILLDSFN